MKGNISFLFHSLLTRFCHELPEVVGLGFLRIIVTMWWRLVKWHRCQWYQVGIVNVIKYISFLAAAFNLDNKGRKERPSLPECFFPPPYCICVSRRYTFIGRGRIAQICVCTLIQVSLPTLNRSRSFQKWKKAHH